MKSSVAISKMIAFVALLSFVCLLGFSRDCEFDEVSVSSRCDFAAGRDSSFSLGFPLQGKDFVLYKFVPQELILEEEPKNFVTLKFRDISDSVFWDMFAEIPHTPP